MSIPNYHVVRFEDMVSDPVAFMKKIYSFADLDISRVRKIRLQAKKSMNKDGTRSYTFGGTKDREILWFDIEDIRNFIRNDVNENQVSRMSAQDKDSFVKHATKSLEYFGYL